MSNLWITLAGIVVVGVVFVLIPVVGNAFLRFRGKRWLRCPETEADAEVGLDARHAAFTAAFHHPALRVKSCSLWPEREGCAQGCRSLTETEEAEPLRARAS